MKDNNGIQKRVHKPPTKIIFDEIAAVAAELLDAEFALVVSKSDDRYSIEGKFGSEIIDFKSQIPLLERTLSQTEPFVISDFQLKDPHMQDFVLAADSDVKFFCGTSLVNKSGLPAGAIVVFDSAPHAHLDNKTKILFQRLAKVAFTADWYWRQLLLIADDFQDLIAVVDKRGERIYQNKSHIRLFGKTDPDKSNDSFSDIHPEDRSRIRDLFERTLRNAKGEQDDFRMVLRDESIHYLESVGTPVFWESDLISHVLIVTRDITKRRKLEEAQQRHSFELEQRANELSSLNEVADLLHRCDTRDEIRVNFLRFHEKVFGSCSGMVYAFDSFTDRFEEFVSWGIPENENIDFSKNGCWAVKGGYDVHIVDDVDPKKICTCEHVSNYNVPYMCVHAQKTDEGDANLNLVLYLEFSNELSLNSEERLRYMRAQQQMAKGLSKHLALAIGNLDTKERLQRAALEDDLTGLYNRKFIEETLRREIVRNVRNQSLLGVMMVDIDHFKDINDQYGHLCGDYVLSEVSKYLKIRSRQTDFLGRFGGEEFLLIIPDSSDDGLLSAAELLRQGIKGLELTWNRKKIQVTVSIGVAVFSGIESKCSDLRRAADATVKLTLERAKQLQDAADSALYEAKRTGRDRVVISSQHQ